MLRGGKREVSGLILELTGIVNQSILHILEHLVTTYSGDDVNEKVSLMLKVCPDIKALLAECARVDRRTMAGYVESLVIDDAKAKKITLETVPEKKSRMKRVEDDVTTPELPEYLDKELWADWCAYRSKPGKPMLSSTIKYSIREMEKAHANGWDVNELIATALAKQWTGFVFDKHRTGRAEVAVNNDVDEDELKRQAYYKECYSQLIEFDTKGYATPEVYRQFVDVMKETNQLVSKDVIRMLFIEFKRLDKGKEWNDSILQRAIDTGYILVDGRGAFDVLTMKERSQ